MANVKADVKQLLKNLQTFSESVSEEIKDMKLVVDHTFDVVVDARYKVLETIWKNVICC